MRKTMHYVLEEMIGGASEIKVTVGTIDLLRLGEHGKLIRAYQTELDRRIGKPLADMTDEERTQIDPDLRACINAWRTWAHMRVCLKKLEFRLDSEGEFVECSLADLGWDTLDGMRTIPLDLFADWDAQAQICNPRVFGPIVENALGAVGPKKVGMIKIE